jgi:hypothetical protein
MVIAVRRWWAKLEAGRNAAFMKIDPWCAGNFSRGRKTASWLGAGSICPRRNDRPWNFRLFWIVAMRRLGASLAAPCTGHVDRAEHLAAAFDDHAAAVPV